MRNKKMSDNNIKIELPLSVKEKLDLLKYSEQEALC